MNEAVDRSEMEIHVCLPSRVLRCEVSCEMEVEGCGSQLCLHGGMCRDALGLTSVTVHLDSVDTTGNSTMSP